MGPQRWEAHHLCPCQSEVWREAEPQNERTAPRDSSHTSPPLATSAQTSPGRALSPALFWSRGLCGCPPTAVYSRAAWPGPQVPTGQASPVHPAFPKTGHFLSPNTLCCSPCLCPSVPPARSVSPQHHLSDSSHVTSLVATQTRSGSPGVLPVLCGHFHVMPTFCLLGRPWRTVSAPYWALRAPGHKSVHFSPVFQSSGGALHTRGSSTQQTGAEPSLLRGDS